jgi:hypothetical protein
MYNDIQIQTPAQLRARIRALRDLVGNRKVANNEALRMLVQMHRETAHRDIHYQLGSRAVLRESVRRGTEKQSTLRDFTRKSRSTERQTLRQSV